MIEAPPLLDLTGDALFADLDGTLTPIRARPGEVGPDARRAGLLQRLSEGLGGALAVISGRTLEDIDRVLGGRVAAVAAVHGLVLRWPNARVERAARPLSRRVRQVVTAFAADQGLLAEDKGLAIALHYRAVPSLAAACEALAARLAVEHGLVVQRGDMVVELRAAGPRKGEALAAFMAAPPFQGRTPVFIGDDLTDEDGFAGAERFAGYGVIVGARRPTRARFALADVAAAAAWLELSVQRSARA